MQVWIVNPCPHPPRRYQAPNSSPVRNGSVGSSALPSNPMADLATTNEMLRSSPSRRRWRRLAGRSSRDEISTHTSPSLISTGKTRASSANWSKVPPLSRSKRAWCQWQVRMPSCRVPRCKGNPMWGQRLSRACTLPSWKKSASGWPATRTEMRPAARTSSNLEAHTKLSERVSSGVTPFPSTRYCMTRTVSGPGPTSALDVPVAAEQVFEWSSIADGRRLVYEPVIGELLHQEVGDVCARDVGAPARFQIQPHTVVVRPRPVGQYHGTYDDPLQIALPQELLLCLFLCVLIPEQRRHEHLHEERAGKPWVLLALPHPPRRLAHEAPQTVLLHRRDDVGGAGRNRCMRVPRSVRVERVARLP